MELIILPSKTYLTIEKKECKKSLIIILAIKSIKMIFILLIKVIILYM